MLHCLCPAEMDGDRQSTKTEKKNPNKKKKKSSEAGEGSLSKRGVVLFKNRSSGFSCKGVVLLSIFLKLLLKMPFYISFFNLCTFLLVIVRQVPSDCKGQNESRFSILVL